MVRVPESNKARLLPSYAASELESSHAAKYFQRRHLAIPLHEQSKATKEVAGDGPVFEF